MPKGPVHWTGPFVLRAFSRYHTRSHAVGPTVPRDGQVPPETAFSSSGGWGLWGLLGLLGLAVLIPRKNWNRGHTTPPRAGGTGTAAHTSDRC